MVIPCALPFSLQQVRALTLRRRTPAAAWGSTAFPEEQFYECFSTHTENQKRGKIISLRWNRGQVGAIEKIL